MTVIEINPTNISFPCEVLKLKKTLIILRPKVMTESEATNPKGRYFKALITAKKQPKKTTTRSLVTLQQRKRRLSKGHSVIPKGDAVPN